MEHDESTFKKYAKAAKQRMVSGFWDKVKEERRAQMEVAATLGVSPDSLIMEKNEQLRNQLYNTHFNEEEEFYNKVKQILDANPDVMNPIGLLADKKYIESATPQQKQAYLLKLSSRYRQCAERYYKEKNNNV